jgi:hypothetical protein
MTLNTCRGRTQTEFVGCSSPAGLIKFAISGPKDLAMAGGSGRPGSPKILSSLDATTAEDGLLEALRV